MRKIITISLVIMLGIVMIALPAGGVITAINITAYPLYVDGQTGDTATPFAIHVTITGWTNCQNADAYLKAYDGTSRLYNWSGTEWYAGTSWSGYPTIHIDGSGDWSGWTYLKSNGRTQFKVRAAKVTDTNVQITSDVYAFTQLLDMSSNGSWIYDSGNPPAGKVIVALDGNDNILGTWVAEDNGITDQFPSAANYPDSPATGFWEMSVPASTSIAKLQARNADNTVYAEDTTPGWTAGSAGTTTSLQDVSLPVTLSSFTAIPIDSGIKLKWRTESEVDNVGFNIYRSEKKDGKFVKLNKELIPGAGNSAMPNDYQFTDKTAIKGKQYYYYLEDVNVSGLANRSSIISTNKDTKILTTTWCRIKRG